jgi:4-hydroxy-tetrahydrodipicolinate reductase
MIRVSVAGVTGWTGAAIAAAVVAADDLELVAGVSRSAAGRHLNQVVDGSGEGVVYASVGEALDAVESDVLVDFTHAAVVKENVLAALASRVAVVVGSSGLEEADFAEIETRAQELRVGVIAAGNFSVLAALLLRFAGEAARHVPAWEIVDYASADKPDVPSGTARELAERLGTVRHPVVQRPPEALLGPIEARGATVAGAQIHSVRLPSFVVSTEVVFAAPGERLVLRHDPNESPAPYVGGTLLAVRAVGGRTGLTRGLDSILP